VVDTHQPNDRLDSAVLSVPEELIPMVRELYGLYKNGRKDSVVKALSDLILQLKTEPKHSEDFSVIDFPPNPPRKPNYHVLVEQEDIDDPASSDFLKSWEDILNLQLYVDTDIYGTLDVDPVAPEGVGEPGEPAVTIEHEDATEIYVQSWSEIAKNMSNLPDDVFTRLWSTIEVAKILECSASMLRRARKESRLPLKVKDLIVDCISHDGKRSLWFVRPS
jgi:hypothetical protein